MADLMTVDWARPGQRAGGSEPFNFWNSSPNPNIDDKLQFAHTWTDSPRQHFEKFKSATTQQVLLILKEIADHRTTLMHAATSGTYQSFAQPDPGLLNDTLDVVKFDPRHCGGWLGLLVVHNVPGQRSALVNRPDRSGPLAHVTWPPATSRRFLDVLAWLMQSIHRTDENLGSGNSWTTNDNMLRFMNGQLATGGALQNGVKRPGLESFVDTLRALVYENADQDLLHFYLRNLRGHGPLEAGRVHHLNEILANTEVDAGRLRTSLDTALAYVLESFPAAWSRTTPGDWREVVNGHLGEWTQGIGNHRPGLEWLQTTITNRITAWAGAGMVDQIGGTRTTQRTVGTTASTSFSTTVTTVTTIRTTIGLAYRQQDSTTWQTTLENALTTLDGLTTTTGGGTSNTTGGSFSNETSATVGGETGAIEEFLLGKLTGEVTDTIKEQLSTQFTTHLEHERASTHSTSSTVRTVSQQTLNTLRERSFNMTEEASQSVSRTIQFGQTLTQSTSSVIAADGNLRGQISRVTEGLQAAQRGVTDALANLH